MPKTVIENPMTLLAFKNVADRKKKAWITINSHSDFKDESFEKGWLPHPHLHTTSL